MFARINTLALSIAFALCASAASVSVRTSGEPATSCNANTGTEQCCNSLNKVTDPIVGPLLDLLGLDLPIDAIVGSLSSEPTNGKIPL
ncbi:hypothetical protein C0995_000538 [Termitomyces sp. Mi166|nr:hypothetical protein C0995_000538 [Termitomyces sp. Mi166\